jgi:biotin operon repressor
MNPLYPTTGIAVSAKPRRTLTKQVGQRQIDKVRAYAAGKIGVTLADISAATGASEAAASARLRDLRAEGFTVMVAKSEFVKGLHYYTVSATPVGADRTLD